MVNTEIIGEIPPLDTTNIITIEPKPLQAFFAGYMDLPPGINASYKRVTIHTKDGETIQRLGATDELETFKDSASKQLSQGYHDWSLINAIRQSKRKVPLRVDLHFFFKTLWKCDIDGGIKACLDATFARLDLNDNLIIDLHVSKRVDDARQRAEIEVYCALPTFK
jgi:Holliday junction resolvase RusA-like endonuclease